MIYINISIYIYIYIDSNEHLYWYSLQKPMQNYVDTGNAVERCDIRTRFRMVLISRGRALP